MMSDLLSAALSYAARGWRVLPLHTPEGGGCSCRRPCGRNAGKHPRIRDWDEYATTDEKTVRNWWKRWPAANIGIATGAGSGLVVVDVDEEGLGTDWLRRLPDSIEAVTGSGGRHVLLAHPGGAIGNRKDLTPGVDIRGDGGYIVAPPSLHRSGRQYEWEVSSHPEDVPLVSVPEWLLERLTLPIGTVQATGTDSGNPAPLAPLVTGCAWLRHCRDDAATLGEQAWYAMLTVLARCESGAGTAQAWSKPHRGYTPEETAAKLAHAGKAPGPITCKRVRYQLDGEAYCARCVQWERIKSPLCLGRGPLVGLEPPPEPQQGRGSDLGELISLFGPVIGGTRA